MKPDLIVIANAVEARLYARESDLDPRLVLRGTLQSPQGRQLPHELADAPLGYERSDRRPEGVVHAPRIDAQRKRHLAFARRLAQRLDAELASDAYGRVALFAGCPFIGELKGQLGRGGRKALRAAVAVDLTHFNDGELQRRISDELHAEAAAQASVK
jgi:hypothetical protein